MRHETPREIAQLLARYAPKKLRSVLEPAAGSGVLALPFILRNTPRVIQLLDVDSGVINKLEASFGNNPSVAIGKHDFLVWSSRHGGGYNRRFDCIVMNPPFAGKAADQVGIAVAGSAHPRKASLEAAFVYRAAHLLRAGGRLLAILPASVISGENTRWLREFLMQSGKVRLVHELPDYTFAGVEARIYIVVYERGGVQGALLSRNHRLHDPDELIISKSSLVRTARFDFRFYEAERWHTRIRSNRKLEWTSLGHAATVNRGSVESPIGRKRVLHTTNLLSPPTSKSRSAALSDSIGLARQGDILMKRVGRDCAQSPTVYKQNVPVACSDCILIIRPTARFKVTSLLFAVRVLIAWPTGAALVEEGVGASYISADRLRKLSVPTNLADLHPQLFKRFSSAVARSDWCGAQLVETRVRRMLDGRR